MQQEADEYAEVCGYKVTMMSGVITKKPVQSGQLDCNARNDSSQGANGEASPELGQLGAAER